MMFPAALTEQATALLAHCQQNGQMIATAESCTGGLIAGLVTDIAGSSAVFDRGFVTYSNAAKTELLGVDAALIAAHGAVSAQVAEAMAAGALARSQAYIALSVTGIAGPGGGSAEKPVGLVYFGLAQMGVTKSQHFMFSGTRQEIRLQAVSQAITLLRDA